MTFHVLRDLLEESSAMEVIKALIRKGVRINVSAKADPTQEGWMSSSIVLTDIGTKTKLESRVLEAID